MPILTLATKPVARPLGKKQRRELKRKQRVLATEQRRERGRKREQRPLAAHAQAARPQPTPAPDAADERTLEPSGGARPPRRRRHVPWISIAILLFPIGAILLSKRLGERHQEFHRGWAAALALVALLVAWLLRKR